MLWEELIGKKIHAFRSWHGEKLSHILFDDGETYLSLSEQDMYDYHDCCSSARLLTLQKDAKTWQMMFDKKHGFLDPKLGHDPF